LSERDQQEMSSKKAIFNNRFLKSIYMVPIVVLLILGGYFYYNAFYAVNTYDYTHLTMDTMVEIRFQTTGERRAGQIKEEVFSEMERLERLFDRTLENSDIYNLNEKAGQKPVEVSPEVFYVAEKALEYAELSGGAFDPTIAPVTDAWGFLGHEYRVPSEEQLNQKLTLVDYREIELDQKNSAVYLPEDDMALELGGIAKGFIVDRAMEVLTNHGVEHAFVNAGGDIGLIGSRPEDDPWRIGVRNPRQEQKMLAVLPVSDKAVATSGDYERSFEEDGVHYHHLLDPETGMPARELASVTIVADSVLEADVLSTTIFVLGREQGMQIIEQKEGVEGVLVTPELDIEYSSGLEEIIELR